ncbi:papilin-like isoform X2 [Leptidea sinapis]|uniref:papilin-like isoform X2 n=2 Tax=Leptidea sinapis TaxID=189913 RepID=UPI0021C3DE0B|nr:papilin-like isoform X2 [Leptidea sinapis]
MWSFKQTENRCVPFYYTGDGGNDNMFESEQDCVEACPSAYVPDVCTLPAHPGDCDRYETRRFFDTKLTRCRQFYYGGCGGNENNFATEAECENRCSEEAAVTTTVQPTNRYWNDYCVPEADPGPCTQFEEMWAFSVTSGTCKRFRFGGCGGNNNRFPDLKTCLSICAPDQEVCQQPMQAGPCQGSFMKWFFDAATGSCSQFTYGGCQGNDNRFDSREDCERRCRSQEPEPVRTTTISPVPKIIYEECQISPELEECQGSATTVWYLDPSRRACVPHDNADNGKLCRLTGVYLSEEECERFCGAFEGIDVCHTAVDPGTCGESITKVFYNVTSDRCEWFTYSGCLGGANRFSSMQECEIECRAHADPCRQEPEPGNCLESYDSWYFNARTKECEEFTYTGCHGNDNRFATKDECEIQCSASAVTTRRPVPTTRAPVVDTTLSTAYVPDSRRDSECQTPSSLEACGVNVTAFYYDSSEQRCVEGIIGNCPNINAYNTEEECERQCGAFRGLDVCSHEMEAQAPASTLSPSSTGISYLAAAYFSRTEARTKVDPIASPLNLNVKKFVVLIIPIPMKWRQMM